MGNEGVIVSGSGTVHSEVLAVGRGAQATKHAGPDDAIRQFQAQLASLHRLIEEQSALLAEPERLKEAVTAVEQEAARERPSGFAIASILEAVARSAGSVTAIASAASELKVLVGGIFS